MAPLSCISIPALTWLVFGLGVVFISVAYMLSKFSRNPKLEAWLNIEIKNIFLNAILLVAFVAFYNASAFIAVEFLRTYGAQASAVSPGACSVDLLKEVVSLLDFVLVKKAMIGLINLLHQIHLFEIFSGYSTKATSIPGLDIGLRLLSGFEVPLQALQMIEAGFGVFIVSLQFQIMTLQAIRLVGFNLLLPVAFMLRVFPLTRDVANELLAVLLSVTILLPLLYLLFFHSFDQVLLSFGERSLYVPDSPHTASENLFEFLGLVFIKYGAIYNLFFSAVTFTLKKVAYYFTIAVLIPTFVFTITMTSIKTFSEVLKFQPA